MCAALEGDVVGPMIRNAGALIARGVPLEVCFAAYLGTTIRLPEEEIYILEILSRCYSTIVMLVT